MYMSFNARAIGLDLSPGETIALAAGEGFGGVDLMVRDLVDGGADPAELRARMDDSGLRGGAFPLPVHWRGEAGEFSRDLERLPRYAEAAATLGLKRTGTWVMPETPGTAGGDDHAVTWALHVERLGAVARVLGACHIRLGLEVIGVATSRPGRGRPFVHRMNDLGPLLGEIAAYAPGIGVVLDSFHLYAAGEPVEAGLAWGVERVVWVHVADLPTSATGNREVIRDQVRGLPGSHGAVESRSLLAALAGAGYNGPVMAEPLAGCRTLEGFHPQRAVHKVTEALRSVWPGASAFATDRSEREG